MTLEYLKPYTLKHNPVLLIKNILLAKFRVNIKSKLIVKPV